MLPLPPSALQCYAGIVTRHTPPLHPHQLYPPDTEMVGCTTMAGHVQGRRPWPLALACPYLLPVLQCCSDMVTCNTLPLQALTCQCLRMTIAALDYGAACTMHFAAQHDGELLHLHLPVAGMGLGRSQSRTMVVRQIKWQTVS